MYNDWISVLVTIRSVFANTVTINISEHSLYSLHTYIYSYSFTVHVVVLHYIESPSGLVIYEYCDIHTLKVLIK